MTTSVSRRLNNYI